MRTYDTLLTGFLIWICFSIVIFILFPIFLPKLTVETNYYLFSISIILILSALVLTYFIILRKEQNEIESSLMSFKNKGFEIFTKKYEKLLYSRDIADVPKIGHILFNFNVLAVAQPNNIEELKLIIKFCERYKIPIIPRGSGTSGYGGVLPVKNGIIINLHHFNRIIALNRNDMTVNVECGVTWENLRKHLVDQGYTLQTYPSSGLSSTVGGWISQGGYGIGSSEYGGIASSVNEVKIIGTEGREFKSNDPNDFVNSCGTLGIVIEAKLKISVLDKLIYVAVSSQNQKALLKAISDYQHLKPYFLRYIDYQTISWENQSITKINLFETTKNCKGGIISMSFKEKDWNEQYFRTKTKNLNFSILSNNIAENIWDDRFYTIRIKRTGPSLIVAEVIIPIKNINAVVDQINNRFNKEKFSIEIITTIENKSILMVWFPTDFRHYSLPIIGSIPYTFHWLRSFEIIRIAIQNEGVPYSTGLWLSPYAKIVLKNQLGEFKRLKKQFDPQKIFNPGKVWGTKIPRFYPIIPWFLIVRFIIPIILIFSRILPKKLR